MDPPMKKSLRQVLGLSSVFPKGSAEGHSDQSVPKIVGHRGSLYECLENTRPGFLRCVELGCDGIELDVFLIRDGNLVVFHDEEITSECFLSLASSTSTRICDLTYEEICGLRFNPNSLKFPCPKSAIEKAQIPLLSQVLQDLKGTGLQVKIELKGPSIAVVQPVLELVESLQMTDQVCYSSFHHDWIKELRALRPNSQLYPTGALFDMGESLPPNYLQMAKDCGATEIHIPYPLCTVNVVREIHQHGFGSMAWLFGTIAMAQQEKYFSDVGNEDEACYQALFDTGVQQLCLNKPFVAMPMIQGVRRSLLPDQGAELT